MKETISRNTLDDHLDDAFCSFPPIELPPSFSDELVRAIEERLAWRVMLSEFGLKITLVAGAIGILLAGLLFPFNNGEKPFISFLLGNWQVVAAVTGILFFTFMFDQVILKYLFHISRKESTSA